MKSLANKIIAAAIALVALVGTAPEAKATSLTLDGTAGYTLGASKSYYSGGAYQSGRYSNLGAGYYRSGNIRISRITSHSSNRSGSLSFELWAMPYYGATSGSVLMTTGMSPLNGYYYYYNVSKYGSAKFVNKYRYPELNLFEYTSYGWSWRDDFTFSAIKLL